MVSVQIISTEYYMCENITKGSLQCKSKELKGMYKCNVLLQTPYAVLFTIIKKNVYKAPAPLPLAVYLYKSVTNIPLLVNLQLHRKGRRKNKRYYKNNILVFGYSVLHCFKQDTVGAHGVSRGPVQNSDEVEGAAAGCRAGLHCTPGSTG